MVNSCLMGLESCQEARGRERKGAVSWMLGSWSCFADLGQQNKRRRFSPLLEAPNGVNGGAKRWEWRRYSRTKTR